MMPDRERKCIAEKESTREDAVEENEDDGEEGEEGTAAGEEEGASKIDPDGEGEVAGEAECKGDIPAPLVVLLLVSLIPSPLASRSKGTELISACKKGVFTAFLNA